MESSSNDNGAADRKKDREKGGRGWQTVSAASPGLEAKGRVGGVVGFLPTWLRDAAC